MNYIKTMKPFSFVVQPLEVTAGNGANITMSFYKFTLNMSFRRTWNWCVWRVKSFEKNCPTRTISYPVLKFIFWNNPSECIPMFSLPRRLLAPVRVVSAERSFSKLKIRQNYCDLVFAKNGQSHFQLYWLKTKLVKE